jgi:protein-tyrosine phosphatase
VIAPRFVDVHSHVVPSGDDGAVSVEEGLELCRAAANAGTRVLFATPHMHEPLDSFPWTPERERRYEEAFAEMQPTAERMGLDLRRGREVYPTEALHGPLDGLRLDGTSAVLVEFPGWWLDVDDAVGLTWAARWSRIGRGHRAEPDRVSVLAHPERCPAVAADPASAVRFAARGWPLCLNGPSVLGDHGQTAERIAWWLLGEGTVSLVASDAHGAGRLPVLDVARETIAQRLGADVADPLFDGCALQAGHD